MSLRAQQLESQFREANEEFSTFLAGLTDADLSRVCPNEQRTIAALARHVAGAYRYELRYFQGIADGAPLPVVAREQIDRNNAAGGERFVDADRGETLEILRRDGETAAQFVAGLTDEQLQQVGAYVDWVPAMSVEKWIEHVLIGHIRGHLTSMRAVVEQTALPS